MKKSIIFGAFFGMLFVAIAIMLITGRMNSNEDKYKDIMTSADVTTVGTVTTEEPTTGDITTEEPSTEEASTEEPYNDVTPPIFTYCNSYPVINIGDEFDIYKYVGYIDDYDSTPRLKVKGDVDTTKAGTYPINVVIKDKSGNKLKQPFTVTVKEKSELGKSNKKPSYNWYKFKTFKKKYKNDNTILGIDVSRWQNDIDFNRVAAAGCKFAIIRIGGYDDGEQYEDRYYATNIRNAKAAGLKVGVYWAGEESNIDEVKANVSYMMNILDGEELDFPIAYDWEDFTNMEDYHVSIREFNECFYAFAEEVKNYGYEAMLYGSKNYLESVWRPDGYPVWVAQYADSTDYSGDYIMWQKGSTGHLSGIETYVDLDVLYKDKYTFVKYPR